MRLMLDAKLYVATPMLRSLTNALGASCVCSVDKTK
jgi:hypothetical protein